MAFFVYRFGIKQGFMSGLGKRIKALREELGMSQLELSEKISVSVNDIELWENNSIKNHPSPQKVYKLANALNSTYAYLVQGFTEDYVKNCYGTDISYFIKANT